MIIVIINNILYLVSICITTNKVSLTCIIIGALFRHFNVPAMTINIAAIKIKLQQRRVQAVAGVGVERERERIARNGVVIAYRCVACARHIARNNGY